MTSKSKQIILLLILLLSCFVGYKSTATSALTAPDQSQHVSIGDDGRLVYTPYPNGDTIPDFSYAGYGGGGVALPDAPVKKTITAVTGDDGANIQAAINEVSALPLDADGFRGAILLKAGTYDVSDSLSIKAGGVVLRGEGNQTTGTIIKATGKSTRTLINITGVSNRAEVAGTAKPITDSYVPVGAHTFNVSDASGFGVGDDVLVVRTPNQEWIDATGMDACSTVGTTLDTSDVDGQTCISESHWTPSSRVMRYERKITAISGNQITIDAPMAEAIQAEFGGGYLAKYQFPGRIEKCGVEHILSYSEYASDTDETHASRMISLSNVQNGWVRNVTSAHYQQGTVLVGGGARYITVQDSISFDHKSVITGGRRYPFSLDDCSHVLVMRCYAKTGRHDYVTGSNTPGPNVFFNSRAEQSFSELGPHHRWATGTLFDGIIHQTSNGAQIMGTYNRGNSGSGHGWSGAYQLFWNCIGDKHRVSSPPFARNWSIGSQATKQEGTGEFESYGVPVTPESLYLHQLKDRLGDQALANIGYSSVAPPPAPKPALPPSMPPLPPPPALLYEAENLSFVTSGPSASIATEVGPSGGKLVSFNAGGIGGWIEFTIPNVPAGTYDLVFKYKTHAQNRGIHNLAFDGVLMNGTVNQIKSGAGTFPDKNFGTVQFSTTGNHVVRLTSTGTTSSIGSFGITADRFALVQDITPPDIDAPEDIESVEATGPGGAVVNFTATATDNKDGSVPVTFNPPSGSMFPLGTTVVTATAKDFGNNEATATFTVTVVDTTPPMISSTADVTLEATGPAGAVANLTASATDIVDGPVEILFSPASGTVFPLGMTVVTATATDAAGNKATASFKVTVRDTTAPVIQTLTASPAMLWPPNHKMVAVTLTAQVDEDVDPAPTTRIISVTSNEPINGTGDGDTAPDWEVTGPLTLNLRAERSGRGSGRVYTIIVKSLDASGNASARDVIVEVRKSSSE